MTEPVYRVYQLMYDELVTEHSDDLSLIDWVVREEIIYNALAYFREKTVPLVYPAKSYAVAIIYALILSREYGITVEDVLRDKDLFLGQDEHYKTIDQDPLTYLAIFSALTVEDLKLDKGWVPYTVEYCRAECTEEGIKRITEAQYGTPGKVGHSDSAV